MHIHISALLFLACVTSSHALTSKVDSLAAHVLEHTLATHYTQAEREADTLWKLDHDRGAFFKTMVRLSRFDDLGDTMDLLQSKVFLDTVHVENPFWKSLQLFQLGFVQAELHSNVTAALNTRKANKGFAAFNSLDARAFQSIYGFYMDQATAWIPFTQDHRGNFLLTLDSAAQSQSLFWPLFATSLGWMHFDRKEFSAGLSVAEHALQRSPHHPIFLQMKADMLFRLGRNAEAAQLYEQSAADYTQRSPNSVRWWSAVGNLVRIYASLGDSTRTHLWQAHFAEPRFKQVQPWMPASLMESLQKSGRIHQ